MTAGNSPEFGETGDAQAKTLTGRRVRLSSPGVQDLDYLWELARSDPSFVLTLSLATSNDARGMAALLQSGRLCHYVIELAASRRPVGYVAAHPRPPARAAVARVGVFIQDPFRHTSLGIEAGAVVVERLFEVSCVRRLEAMTYSDGLATISTGLDRLFNRDAILRQASYYMGRFWDLHVLSLGVEEWKERGPRFRTWLHGQRQVGGW